MLSIKNRTVIAIFITLFTFSAIATTFSSCSSDVAKETSGENAPIYPDYLNISIPANIAPLNFGVKDATKLCVDFEYAKGLHYTTSGADKISISQGEWEKMLASKGEIKVHVSVWNKEHPDGIRYSSFSWFVQPQRIDGWIAYRLIPPGYESWRNMAIRQRDLSSFQEELIVSNRQNKGGCMNCHSFNQYNPEQMMFHARGTNGGTVIKTAGGIRKVEINKLPPQLGATYPAWHPSGKWIAFSSNDTHQAFYHQSRDKVEVYDLHSDLILYNVDKQQVITDKRFTDTKSWETFPSFSPDGKHLFFCSALAKEMPVKYDSLHYSLLRTAFDESTGSLGEKVDTLYKDGSVSFPRISPDGKYLLFTRTDCATFPIWHKEADLKMIRLEDNKQMNVEILNSNDVESYHSWSSNGRWIIFSSRREDGRYTRLFIAYFDDKGNFHKPFLLPQKSPWHNELRMESYNIPEFIKAPVHLSSNTIANLFK